MKNIFFKICVFIAQRFVKQNKVDLNSLRILVLSTTGLGDSLWATPAFEKIKQKYPTSYLAVLTTNLGGQVFFNNPHINQIFFLENLFSFKCFKLWNILRKNRFQIVFQFHSSQRYTLPLCSTIGAEKVVGTQGLSKGLDSLFTDSFIKKKEHEIERRLHLLKTIHIQSSRSSPQYFLTKKDRASLCHDRSSLAIGIHPGAKDGYKCWPISHFVTLGKLFETHLDCKIYITGTESEKEYTEYIKSQLQNASSVTELPLRAFACLLSQMNLFVSNDTGPMHLSCALNIPTIGIFSATDPDLCGPTFKGADLIYKPKTCNPCLKRKCIQPFCFYQISPSMVFHKARTLLSNPKKESSCSNCPKFLS